MISDQALEFKVLQSQDEKFISFSRDLFSTSE